MRGELALGFLLNAVDEIGHFNERAVARILKDGIYQLGRQGHFFHFTLRVIAAVRASGLPMFNYAEGAAHGKGVICGDTGGFKIESIWPCTLAS